MRQAALYIMLIGMCCVSMVAADQYNHRYASGDEVYLYANKVGPFYNPQEYYSYYSLPYCPPDKFEGTFESIGEAIQGYELTKMHENILFGYDMQSKLLCEQTLSADDAAAFISAIKHNYWYQLFIDDLPLWGMVGESVVSDSSEEYYIYTHKHLDISYNVDRIIEVNLTSENAVLVRDKGFTVPFTYSITWTNVDTPFDQRFEKYLDTAFFEHKIHWFSILNSLMLVIFLAGLVLMILMRTMRRNFGSKFDEDIEEDVTDESGWKIVHRDVFRSPNHLVIFSSLIGSGCQLASLVFLVLVLAIPGFFYKTRGAMLTVVIICYVVTCVVGGYVSGGYYKRQGGLNWIKTLLLTNVLLPFTVASLAFVINFSAVYYKAQSHIPVGTMFVMTILWLVTLPLTAVGTMFGRHLSAVVDNKKRIKRVPRPIPDQPWYTQSWVNMLLGGLLPFASIFIELYFLFTSFWHYKYYYVYGLLLLVFTIMVLVTSCVSVVSTYFLLNAEDYRWQWSAFLTGASTALYVYCYAAYYYFQRTQMSGWLQMSFYFGYMFMLSFGLALLCGGISFYASSMFVKRIYQNVKFD